MRVDLRTFLRKDGFVRGRFRTVVDPLLTLLYPPHCAACRNDTASGVYLCEACAEGAKKIELPRCEICSQPFDGAISSVFSCSECVGRKFHFECAIAPYRARGIVREFIHKFKYEGQYYLRHVLAEWMGAALEDPRLQTRAYDCFVPVPLHPARERQREFNQAEVLAALVAKRAGKPMVRYLDRTRYTTTQTRLNREERLKNLHGAFRIKRRMSVAGKHLVLVDDIFTTGSTVEECSRVLRSAGAASVRVLTVARA